MAQDSQYYKDNESVVLYGISVFTVFLYSPLCLVEETQLLTQVASEVGKGDFLKMCHIHPSDNLDYICQTLSVIHMHPLNYQQSSQCVLLILVVDWREGYTRVYTSDCVHISPMH